MLKWYWYSSAQDSAWPAKENGGQAHIFLGQRKKGMSLWIPNQVEDRLISESKDYKKNKNYHSDAGQNLDPRSNLSFNDFFVECSGTTRENVAIHAYDFNERLVK